MKIIDIATREYRRTTSLDIIDKDSTSFELVGFEPNVDIEVDVALRTIFKLEWVTTVTPTLKEHFIGNKNKLAGMISFLKKVGYKFPKTQTKNAKEPSTYKEAIELCHQDNPSGFTIATVLLDYLKLGHTKAKNQFIQKQVASVLRDMGFNNPQKRIDGRKTRLWVAKE